MKRILLFAVLVASAVAMAACGASSSGSKPPTNQDQGAVMAEPASEIVIKASNFKFDMAEYKVKKGQPVKLTLQNVEGVHGVAISGVNLNLKAGETVEYTFDKAGTYDIVCNIYCGAGHAQMRAKLTVVE